jgi:cell division protein FtsB
MIKCIILNILQKKGDLKMEEKKVIKISLSTILLVLAIIVIVVMGIFTQKLYNENASESEKTTSLQTQLNSLNETVSDLQERIDSASYTTVSNSSTTNSIENTTETTTESETTTTNFTEKEIKTVLQKCLNLESAKTNGPGTILYTLGLYTTSSDENSEKPAEKTGFIKTSITFTNFKESMLKYMTEDCYKEQWGELFDDEDGYLCYANVGASGISYTVNTISKVANGYTANVTETSEGPNTEITVKFKIDSDECVVKSYEF